MKQIFIAEDVSFLNKLLVYNLIVDGYAVTTALKLKYFDEEIE